MIRSLLNNLCTSRTFQAIYNHTVILLGLKITLILLFPHPVLAQTDSLPNNSKLIYYFQLREMVAAPAFLTVEKAIEEAENSNADLLIMDLNTYGGEVSAADSIRTALMNAKPTTIAWINNNAASAGALISIACDSIYMTNGANIGASTVVNEQGEKMPDKYQSYMRSIMRSTAEAKGRNPKIAEAMVDEHIAIPGIIDSTHVLTMTTSEAIANGFCEGEANSLSQLIKEELGISDYNLVKYKPTLVNRIVGFLINPVVNSILLLMIMGGIWFELQSPGVGFPILAAIIGAVLFFAPLYLEGLADNWEIALFFIGVLLLILEIFVAPGFGLFGILGILAIIISLTFSLIDNNQFEFSSKGMEQVAEPLFRISLMMAIMLALFFTFGSSLFKSKSFQKLILNTEESKDRGFTVEDKGLKSVVGQEGVVVRECKPFGKVKVNSEIYDAKSEHGWLDPGQLIQVIGTSVNNLIVRKKA